MEESSEASKIQLKLLRWEEMLYTDAAISRLLGDTHDGISCEEMCGGQIATCTVSTDDLSLSQIECHNKTTQTP